MSERREPPRVHALPPGADFPAALVEGLLARMRDQPPEALARVSLLVNSGRMQRRIRDLFAASGARLLPRIRLVTDLAQGAAPEGLPPAVPPLRRRLELTQLVARLLDREPDLAPRAAIYDLADSLATLMEEMQGEGVDPAALAALDLSDHSRHWERSLRFLSITAGFFDPADAPDAALRQRLTVQALAETWRHAPPRDPIIVAGSTGSRGTTALLMRAVAALPAGALVLPGFDFDLPEPVWSRLADMPEAEDHPQYRYARLLRALSLHPDAVRPWHPAPPPSPARNRLVSLSLRPAPVTDQWLIEGETLGDLRAATAGLSLIEAGAPREEALAIALRLRAAVEEGRRAALITPDRVLGRQVTAALDRWGILPDDSAGRPLALSAPGRFLRQVAALSGQRVTAESLIALLGHPLCHSGRADRGRHLLWTRALEQSLREEGPAFPTGGSLQAWAAGQGDDPDLRAWAEWIAEAIAGLGEARRQPLTDHVADHLRRAALLARGPAASRDDHHLPAERCGDAPRLDDATGGRDGSTPPEGRARGTEGDGDAPAPAGALWEREAGRAARTLCDRLVAEAVHGGPLGPHEYADLFTAILSREQVRDPAQPHAGVMIWGTLEARVQGADLVILGGLNDGTWPRLPPPDPWLSRPMRRQAGLLMPERQIGLAAHDYQQAVAAPEVVLSRARRDGEAPTIPARWLNRLVNLLAGLPGGNGPEALAAMRERGGRWLTLARMLDRPDSPAQPATRPAPRPPVSQRPRKLSVTDIEKLIRDPYEIYARRILGLRAMRPLRPRPDARLRGSVLHGILEEFAGAADPARPEEARETLIAIARARLDREIPWPSARRLWLARLERATDWLIAREARRVGRPELLEASGAVALDGRGFTLTARPDRIDLYPDGRIEIVDYKTGKPPTEESQRFFDKQLLLEAAMAERGAFAALGRRRVARIAYVGVGSAPSEVATEMTEAHLAETWAGLEQLIDAYSDRAQGYTAMRAPFSRHFEGDYEQLSRFGEWDLTAPANPVEVE